jgi:signal peptidase I
LKSLKLIPWFFLLAAAVYLFGARQLRLIRAGSESMLPAINPGERVAVINHKRFLPERGSIVCLVPPDNGREYRIRRVVGLPGDVLEIKNGGLYLNGEPQDEPYLYEEKIIYRFGPEAVPEEHVFVLGDNRNNSPDSSEPGVFPAEGIIGRPVMVCWPHIHFLR